MKLKDKYVFRQYNLDFPELFEKEKLRLQNTLGKKVSIEHIGSTAVFGLGGKGVIDISVAVSKNKWVETSEKLKILGYKYKKKDEEQESQRFFFMANLPDDELGTRIYHIHLTYSESDELKREIGFRDYLRKNSRAAKEYAILKKMAVEKAHKFNTKNEMRDVYGKMKEAFIQKIIKKCGIKT